VEELASVIIPLFNQAAFIGKAISSVLAQTYGDIEVVVVDDGSSDESTDIVRSIADPRLRLVEQENRGPSAALNTGLRHSRGKYLALLGGDDMAHDRRIEKQIDALERGALDSVFCKPQLIDSNDQPIAPEYLSSFFNVPPGSDPAVHFRKLFADANYLCAPSHLMRRDVVDRIGYFHEGLVQAQDFEYAVRMTSAGMKLLIVEEPLVLYRRHSQNLSRANHRNNALRRELLTIYRHFLDFASPRILRSAFADIFDPELDLDRALSPDELGFIFMSHSDPSVRAIAVEYLVQGRKDQATLHQSGKELMSFKEYLSFMDEPY
jgi:glycosyltransferase involved in cell wall biosynthesis